MIRSDRSTFFVYKLRHICTSIILGGGMDLKLTRRGSSPPPWALIAWRSFLALALLPYEDLRSLMDGCI